MVLEQKRQLQDESCFADHLVPPTEPCPQLAETWGVSRIDVSWNASFDSVQIRRKSFVFLGTRASGAIVQGCGMAGVRRFIFVHHCRRLAAVTPTAARWQELPNMEAVELGVQLILPATWTYEAPLRLLVIQ